MRGELRSYAGPADSDDPIAPRSAKAESVPTVKPSPIMRSCRAMRAAILLACGAGAAWAQQTPPSEPSSSAATSPVQDDSASAPLQEVGVTARRLHLIGTAT